MELVFSNRKLRALPHLLYYSVVLVNDIYRRSSNINSAILMELFWFYAYIAHFDSSLFFLI